MATVLFITDRGAIGSTIVERLKQAVNSPQRPNCCDSGMTGALQIDLGAVAIDTRAIHTANCDRFANIHMIIVFASAARAVERMAGDGESRTYGQAVLEDQHVLSVAKLQSRRTADSNKTVVQSQTQHAVQNWLRLILPVLRVTHDVPTVKEWSREVAHSVATIKRYCAAVGVSASNSLDFARALRIVDLHAGRPCRWFDALAIADASTLMRFLGRAGFERHANVPVLDAFLEHQRYITDCVLVDALRENFKE